MSIIPNINTSNWVRSQSNTVENELRKKQRQIIEILGYEMSITFVFNENKNLAFTKSIYTKGDKSIEKKIPAAIYINKSFYTGFKNLFIKKDLIENYSRYGDTMLVEGMESEVLIPLFDCHGDDMIIVGCLYLASPEHKELESYALAEYFQINSIIGSISKLSVLASKNLGQRTNIMNMIYMFLEILKHKESFLPNHSYNVANWCKAIGIELGFSQEELNKIYLAGLLHDVGKTMVDYNILNKADKLTEEEYKIIKKHSIDSCVISKYILGDIRELKDIPKIIRHHHERFDGQGYPDGLKGDEVLFYSYIVGIADAVDAMLSNRPYRKRTSISNAIEQLYKNKGTQFHPELVDIMVKKLIQAQKQLNETIEESINLSTLIINFKERVEIFEGALMKYGDCYRFSPVEEIDLEKPDLPRALDMELVVKNINNIHHYQVKIEDFSNNSFYISSLKLIPTTNTFNLLWNLDGILYLPNSNEKIDIEIIRIGGGDLSFSLYKDLANNIPKGKPMVMKILFEEEFIEITGNIIRVYDMGPHKYFDYFYTKIPDFKRDFIFRQLFRKQIELRKAVSKYN